MIKDSYPSLKLQRNEDLLTITIDRPDALNAINDVVMQSLHSVFSDLKDEASVRGVIITGAGDKAFAAGADIKAFSFDGDLSTRKSAFGHETFRLIETSPVPVIAAIHGYALGGGCELAMACHIRIAAENAVFGQPEINLGLVPGYGGSQRLPQLIGKGRAMEWLLTAKMVDASEAYRVGLVNQVVPDAELFPTAYTMLKKIATKAPLAAGHTIALVNAHYEKNTDGFAEEVECFGACFHTEDAREGVQAFLEKRKPVFKGK